MNKEKIKLDNGEAHIIDGVCANSKHRARFLANENEEYCQCSFGNCKVRVSISNNGHDPYIYILTQQEIENLPTKKIEEIPQMKGTRKDYEKCKELDSFIAKVYEQAHEAGRQEAIEECIQVVPEKMKYYYKSEGGGGYCISEHDICREQILSALSSLKDKSITPIEEIPQMKGTREALENLTIRKI